jgi:hypothetical protein
MFGFGSSGSTNCTKCGKCICKKCCTSKRVISRENRHDKVLVCDLCDTELDNYLLMYTTDKVLRYKSKIEKILPKQTLLYNERENELKHQIADIDEALIIPTTRKYEQKILEAEKKLSQ